MLGLKRWIAVRSVRFLLRLDNRWYAVLSRIAVHAEGGVHPKHRLIRYFEWFLDRIPEGGTVLDVGCGRGELAVHLAGKARRVYALDLDEAKLNRAASHERVRYLCADATKMDFSSFEAVDCVVLSNVLEHLEERVSVLSRMLSELSWRSAPRFLIRVPMLSRGWLPLYKKELGVDYRLDPTHCVEYTHESFRREMEEAGLIPEEYRVDFGEIYAVCVKR